VADTALIFCPLATPEAQPVYLPSMDAARHPVFILFFHFAHAIFNRSN